MALAVVLACVLLVISAATALPGEADVPGKHDGPGEPVVACYVDGSEHRLRTNLSLCTYVILSSATVEEDSTFRSLMQDADVSCTSPTAMKDRNPALKTLLGVEVRQSRLQLLKNPGVLDNFTASALKYLKEKNYDGLELTWVENGISDERARNTEDLTALLKALRDRIKGDPDPTGNESLLLSVTLLDRSDEARFHTDNGTWSQYVDFISVVPSNLECEDSQIDRMVRYLQDEGFELQKILIALPAFGGGSHHKPGRNFTRTEDVRKKAERTYGPGLMMAKQVCQAIRSGETELKTLANFEGVQSPGAEVSGLLQKGLGGVGVVAIDVDNFEDSLCLNLTKSDKVILKSKVMSTHHALLFRGHHHHHCHHHRRHHHHEPSVDSNSSSHHHHRNHAPGHHHHGHSHHGHDYSRHGHRGHGHHGHGHRGHGHHGHGHGHHGHGHHGHGHHGHGHHGHGLGNQSK